MCGFHVTIVTFTFAMFTRSTPFPKPTVVHRLIISSKEFKTWSDIWPLAEKSVEHDCSKNISTARNTVWQNRLVRYPFHRRSKTVQWNGNVWIESFCVQQDKVYETYFTIGIGKQVPTSVSVSPNLVEERIFLRNSIPRDLVESLVDSLNDLATESKDQMKLYFFADWDEYKRHLQSRFLSS